MEGTQTATVAAIAERFSGDSTTAVIRMITDIALDQWTILVAGIVFLLLRYATRITHSGNDHVTSIVRRLLPFLPEALGVLISVMGGVPGGAGTPLIIRVAVGLWAAYVATKIHKILGQTVLGDDTRLERAAARLGRKEGDLDGGEAGVGGADDGAP